MMLDTSSNSLLVLLHVDTKAAQTPSNVCPEFHASQLAPHFFIPILVSKPQQRCLLKLKYAGRKQHQSKATSKKKNNNKKTSKGGQYAILACNGYTITNILPRLKQDNYESVVHGK